MSWKWDPYTIALLEVSYSSSSFGYISSIYLLVINVVRIANA